MSLVNDVTAALAASSYAELHTVVVRAPRLVGDEVADMLRLVADNARSEGEFELANHAVAVAALLRRCRLVGPTEAFAEAQGQAVGVEDAWVAAIAARDAGHTSAAESAWRQVLALLPAGVDRPVPLARIDALAALGAIMLGRYQDGEGSAHLDEAVLLCERAAVEAAPDGRADHQNNYGAALMARYDLRGIQADVDNAVTAFTTAAFDGHASAATKTFARSSLGSALLARYEASGARADLDAGIGHLEAALDASGTRPNGAVPGNLGLGLLSRYEAAGDPDDLSRAVAALRDAVALWPADSPEWSGAAVNLGNALLQSFHADGNVVALDEAIAITDQAVAGPGSRAIDLPAYRNALGACLMARFEQSGQLDDLDRAVGAFRRAVDSTDLAAPDRAIYLDNLAGGRLEQFVRRGDVTDVRAAISAAESAILVTGPAAPERPRRLATLANCLASDPAVSAAGVERIVSCYAEARRLSPPGSPEWWLYTANFASGLLDRYRHRHDPDDLDGAVRGYRTALAATPPGVSGLSALHYNLAGALDLRSQRSGDGRDRTAALAELRLACRLGAQQSPDVALLAGRDLGDHLARDGHWPQATEAYDTAVSAMLRLVRVQAVRADSEIRLQETSLLTANATLSAVRCDRHNDAVRMLDQGRALLLSFVLERERIDLSRLRGHGDVELADRYQRAAVLVSRLEVGQARVRAVG